MLLKQNANSTQRSIHTLFEEIARRSPDRVALEYASGRITYAELNRRSNRVANRLLSMGLRGESLVGLLLERSPELIVAILGILKAGCAYVPFDPEYPPESLAMMIEDAAPALLISGRGETTVPTTTSSRVISLAELEYGAEDEENPRLTADETGLAYVMFTSGSTGRPKGVMIEHKSVVRLVREADYADFSEENVFLLFAPVTFDASTFEIWGALLNGARLAIMPPGVSSLADLGDAIRRYGVTTLWLTAGLFHLMVDERLEDLRPLRQLLAGGDVLSVSHIAKALDSLDCDLINGYGPTENTTFTCCYKITAATDLSRSIPIGKSIAGTQVYLLDEGMMPVAEGEPGEIYAGGDGLARGYLNSEHLTAERFVFSEHADLRSIRLYRTGDCGRLLPDGNIEFLGRTDNQIKIRGFRVELGEIENLLKQNPAVRQAVVVAKELSKGDKQLNAFVVLENGWQVEPCDIRKQLQAILPDHMVPTFIFPVDEIPLTPNGKVDRIALVNSITSLPVRPPSGERLEAGIEGVIASELEKILNEGPVGADDNFFDLGATSLQLASLHSRLESALGRDLRITELFKSPTVRSLARSIGDSGGGSPDLSSRERGARQRAALARSRRVQIGGVGQ